MRIRLVLLGCLLASGCAVNFYKAITPSGTPCTDMKIYPAGASVTRPYHRLKPVASDAAKGTEAERLESLRMVACTVGGDAVIEAANEETRTVNGTYATRASGTAVVWLRGGNTGSKMLPNSATTLPSTKTAPVELDPAIPTPADEAAEQPGVNPVGPAPPAEEPEVAPAPPQPTAPPKATKKRK